MAREHARIMLSVWDDPDFTSLPHLQQWTYVALFSSRYLSYCGVHPLVPARLAGLASDLTERKVAAALRGLADARFIVVDQQSVELCVRSYVYWDGILKQPNMVRAMNRAYERIVSPVIQDTVRESVGHAVARAFPDGVPGGVAKALAEGFAEGFSEGFGEGSSHSPSPFPLPPTEEPRPSSSDVTSVPRGPSLRAVAGAGDAR